MTAWPEVRIDATAAPSSRHTLAELLPQDCHASATLNGLSRTYPVRALRRSAALDIGALGLTRCLRAPRRMGRGAHPSLRANGSRECAPDDRLRDLSAEAQRAKAEAIQSRGRDSGLLRRYRSSQ